MTRSLGLILSSPAQQGVSKDAAALVLRDAHRRWRYDGLLRMRAEEVRERRLDFL